MTPALSKLGFKLPQEAMMGKSTFFPQCISISGKPGEGKTELALSAPGLIAGVTVDRGYHNIYLNPTPPKTRNPNHFWNVIEPPLNPGAQVKGAQQDEFVTYWLNIRSKSYEAAALPEVRTLLVDGDSDTWEIQRIAEFGRLSQVPPHMYVGVNAARRVYYAKISDYSKFTVYTSKMTKEYIGVYRPDGTPELDDKGKQKRVWSGNWERQGFDGLDYYLQMHLSYYRKDAKYDKDGNLLEAGEFAARLEMCKPNHDLDGCEFSGDSCNLPAILKEVYPHIPLSKWGY